MTTIALISDLHLNHWSHLPQRDHHDHNLKALIKKCEKADIILNAGDSGEANDTYNIQSYTEGKPYFEAMGNHDYYGGTFRNDFYGTEIGKFRIFVGTLWTNFNRNHLSQLVAQRAIGDFRLIEGANVESMTAAFDETVQAIEDFKPHIVLTHFAPTLEAVDYNLYGATPLNAFFCNNLRDFIFKQKDLRLWCYGHSHSAMEYKVGNIQIASNPLGYPKENFKSIDDYQPKFYNVS